MLLIFPEMVQQNFLFPWVTASGNCESTWTLKETYLSMENPYEIEIDHIEIELNPDSNSYGVFH